MIGMQHNTSQEKHTDIVYQRCVVEVVQLLLDISNDNNNICCCSKHFLFP